MIYDLVFEGGGAKGVVLIGAVQEFLAQGHQCGRLLGTSAGAITAAFLAADYTPDEMNRALNEKVDGKPVFTSFVGTPPRFSDAEIESSAILDLLRAIDMKLVPNAFGVEERVDYQLAKSLMRTFRHLSFFIERGGWYSADAFVDWLRQKLDEGQFRGGPRRFSHMTLEEFYQASGRELSLVTSDTTAHRMIVMNHKTAPLLPLVWAVRMSMSIPMVWPEVEWQKTWGTYLGRDLTGHKMVDGGLLSNFPIELFISDDQHITEIMGPKSGDAVIGMLIDEELAVEGAPPAASTRLDTVDLSKLQVYQRVRDLINTATKAHDKMVIEAFERMVVRLPAQGYGTVEFDMSDARREVLVAVGREKMKQHLAERSASGEPLESLSVPPEAARGPVAEVDVAAHADRIASRILTWE